MKRAARQDVPGSAASRSDSTVWRGRCQIRRDKTGWAQSCEPPSVSVKEPPFGVLHTDHQSNVGRLCATLPNEGGCMTRSTEMTWLCIALLGLGGCGDTSALLPTGSGPEPEKPQFAKPQ